MANTVFRKNGFQACFEYRHVLQVCFLGIGMSRTFVSGTGMVRAADSHNPRAFKKTFAVNFENWLDWQDLVS